MSFGTVPFDANPAHNLTRSPYHTFRKGYDASRAATQAEAERVVNERERAALRQRCAWLEAQLDEHVRAAAAVNSSLAALHAMVALSSG